MLPFTLKANGTFEQRENGGGKDPARTCNEGAGSQAPAALRGLMMGLVSNPGVPEQLIGKSCYKTYSAERGSSGICEQCWNAGKGAEGSESDFSLWEKPFSNLRGSPGHPSFGGEASI